MSGFPLPYNVGLTGNLGAGKSTVTERFAAWGATIIDADQLTREVQRAGSPAVGAIATRFGADVLAVDGSLDRAALRTRLTSDPDALAALNAIVHPAVRALRATRMADAARRGDLIVVNAIPLLFEVLAPTDFDCVVLVDAPPSVRLHRARQARDVPESDLRRLMAAQLPADAKRDRSDFVIENDTTLPDLERRAGTVWRALRRRAAARFAAGAAGAVLVVARDPLALVRLAGGTIARYVDAGLDVRIVVCEPRSEPGSRTLADIARALGGPAVASLYIDHTAGAVPERILAAVGQPNPALVLWADTTPEVSDTPIADVRRALEVGQRWRFASAISSCDSERITARLDIRPWRAEKRAALDVAGAPHQEVHDQECFLGTTSAFPPLPDIFTPSSTG